MRLISAKKNEPEFMLEWRLKAYRHWLTMTEPKWQKAHYPPIDYQASIYYAAPKPKKVLNSLDEVDPVLLRDGEAAAAAKARLIALRSELDGMTRRWEELETIAAGAPRAG